jgi:hypothetical protein
MQTTLIQTTTATPYLYADDTTLVSINSIPDAVETQSQQSYSEAKQWFLKNKMTLNEEKTAQLLSHATMRLIMKSFWASS